MIMDILVLAVFALSIFFSLRKGFAAALAGFFKGIAAVVLAWFFCDDLAAMLLKVPAVHTFAVEKISQQLSVRWESSDIYNALPELFTSGENNISNLLINEGAGRLSALFLTILSFFLILVGVRLLASAAEKLFSHKERGGFIGFSDRLLGLLFGIVIAIFNILLFLALLLPLVGIIVPSWSETLPQWFEGSYVAKDIYDNNLLLILIRDFIV